MPHAPGTFNAEQLQAPMGHRSVESVSVREKLNWNRLLIALMLMNLVMVTFASLEKYVSILWTVMVTATQKNAKTISWQWEAPRLSRTGVMLHPRLRKNSVQKCVMKMARYSAEVTESAAVRMSAWQMEKVQVTVTLRNAWRCGDKTDQKSNLTTIFAMVMALDPVKNLTVMTTAILVWYAATISLVVLASPKNAKTLHDSWNNKTLVYAVYMGSLAKAAPANRMRLVFMIARMTDIASLTSALTIFSMILKSSSKLRGTDELRSKSLL